MSENDTLTAKQRRALAALLSEPTVKDAASKAGVSRKTLYRYLSEPAFQDALTGWQHQVLRGTSARLAGLLQKALDVIALDMEPGVDGGIQLRAAGLVLRHVAGLTEFVGLEERVRVLEENVGERGGP